MSRPAFCLCHYCYDCNSEIYDKFLQWFIIVVEINPRKYIYSNLYRIDNFNVRSYAAKK